MKLKDRVSLITGAARGIGREIALAFAREGSDVVVCDVDLESAQNTQKEIEALGRRSLSFKVDVTNSGQIEEMVNLILDKFSKIDILVNNAGITKDNLILRMSEDEWDKVLSVNLKGAFNCIKVVSRHMLKKRYGRIVNLASIIGMIGNAGQANYAASKGGLIALTKSVAKELASRNINVNAVAPGFIQTPMTDKLPEDYRKQMLENIPMGKFGGPQDVANVCLFLVSPESDYITGQVVVVDGGMTM
ncbi:MAG: 3-oxoacyl-[acyl-carrier-protein] reductase [Candidatus Omnitrophica bacterium]|nr:3-oxoacyl-[acyl-carrier-protein] reductase [Candidatus Omnitrophota bacterium]MDD5352704.1 3-oxoacyl-[acyl-carrier-protein] reductase [Candidatus Omnitrophota bacterium]MDD5550303.1 3-oxoacyl-[acyl-carrier-protein] reductase [Candidatus Omnitrophota bacterium]